MTEEPEKPKHRSKARDRVDEIEPYPCKNLITVLEDSHDIRDIGTVIKNEAAP